MKSENSFVEKDYYMHHFHGHTLTTITIVVIVAAAIITVITMFVTTTGYHCCYYHPVRWKVVMLEVDSSGDSENENKM